VWCEMPTGHLRLKPKRPQPTRAPPASLPTLVFVDKSAATTGQDEGAYVMVQLTRRHVCCLPAVPYVLYPHEHAVLLSCNIARALGPLGCCSGSQSLSSLSGDLKLGPVPQA